MTDTLFRIANRRLFLGLTTAVLVTAWANSSATAGDVRPETEFSQKVLFTGSSQVADDAVDAIFDARWGIEAKDYVLGQDGQLRRTSADARTSVKPRPSETKASAPRGEYSHFDISPVPNQNLGAGSCDASPLSAADTARLVAAAARKYDVDPDFALAVATVESSLDRVRNSPKGARGPMQLMPATAGRLGVKDVCDPADNIDGGVRFLGDLFATYRNPLIVAAAYNAGEARVREYGGIPPFPETVNFVAEVLKRQSALRSADPEATAIDAAVNSASADDTTSSTGTIPSTRHRQWVGGVMQF
ncbi:lytic transglycosylase domain-containing protein [Mesorhizobium qingshengii]|uniref:Soluble lytic murein transglycosylase n=1 Tax=Mesorhizobium qingshengii TaxID=1165689 RepID=A0A1G5ZCV4_9HYPH|nr:lytic transglycosylase domain-containing protein [Mesorhizobium qingshengii]SDA92422.1 Soluble lytic murein transglycosylase [Mesorhizobium qingshengii]